MAVALAEQVGNLQASKLLNWPESTIRLYRKQLSGEEGFAKDCDETRLKIGARYYDLIDGAQQRLAEMLEQDRLSASNLIGLCSVATRAGNECLGFVGAQQPGSVTVNVRVDGNAVLGSLAAIAERLGAEGPLIEGPAKALDAGSGEE